jgi:hypothetical protein
LSGRRGGRLAVPLAILALSGPGSAPAQQVADSAFRPVVGAPAYPDGGGPVVLIDGGHHNFHTVDGRFLPFAELLRRDGYAVRGSTGPFTAELLADADVLVVSNALAERNLEEWTLPTPSAFAEHEIDAVEGWVRDGGGLLLIADHMPFPGAVVELAARFGVFVGNGFAFPPDSSGLVRFRRAAGSLRPHPISNGRAADERVDVVISFTGQAFRLAAEIDAYPLLVLEPGSILLLPVTAWEFSEQTPRIGAEGMLQGAALRVGAGRVAAFGEAAMFTAQLGGPERRPIGMNFPEAARNGQFALNVLHWLTGLLPAR